MVIKRFLFLILFLLYSAPAFAVSVPWTMNFDSSGDWSSYIYVEQACSEEDRGHTTHVTSGCYSGGCMKIEPPRAKCTGDGTNGGAVGIWPSLEGLGQVMHVRFLVKYGPTHRDNTRAGGYSPDPFVGTTMNKFVNLYSTGGREGILKTQTTLPSEDPRGYFLSMALQAQNEAYIYESPPSRGWIQDSDLTIDLNSANNYTASDANGYTWLSLEYMINKTTGVTEFWLYSTDGLIQNVRTTRTDWDGGNFSALHLGGYFNAYVIDTGTDQDYILIDNLQVSSSYIGPPAGFVGGGDITDPTVTSFIIPSTSQSLTVSITEFIGSDDAGVTGYCVNESAITPTAETCSGSGWESSAQSSYTFSSEGTKTLYAWVKDAANNISSSVNDSVTITIPLVIQSAVIGTSGSSITLTFNKNVYIGLGGSSGLSISLSGGAVSPTYSSGSGFTSLVYNLNRTIYSDETGDLSYTQPTNGIEDSLGNDLGSFSDFTITNNSEELEPTPTPTGLSFGGSGGLTMSGEGGVYIE